MRLWNTSGHVCRDLQMHRWSPVGSMAKWLAVTVVLLIAAAPTGYARVESSILVNAQTGRVLEAHNANKLCYPASLAKLMTLYITFQRLTSGKMSLGEEVPVSYHASIQPPTKLYLRSGERISVRSAILAITTRSANDAAVVLAEAIGGSERKFAGLMNEQAHELGMYRTTFRNASGLPNTRQVTTARDMSTLALAIIHTFPRYYHFFDARSFVFRGTTIGGHDFLLGNCPGVDGMKTGYTYASGFNLVTSAVRHGQRLVGVLMGMPTAFSRDRRMIALINLGFNRIQTHILTANSQEEPQDAAGSYREASDENSAATHITLPHFVWIVQIGQNFRSRYQARRALRSALRSIPERFKSTTPMVVRLGRRRYRARLSDTSETMARETCRLLRGKRFTCSFFRLRVSTVDVASAGR